MTVQTSKISGRREVSYQSLDDIQADAERLAAQPVELLGNWSLGQIFVHLATGMEMSIDGFPMKAPAPVRWVARWFVKPRILRNGMKPGFQLPRKASAVLPAEGVSTEEGLAHLQKAIARLRSEPTSGWHPIFGKMTPAETHLMQLRHAEMHLSFVIPRGLETEARGT